MITITERIIEKSREKIPDFERKYLLRLLKGNKVRKKFLFCMDDEKNGQFSLRNLVYAYITEDNYNNLIDFFKTFDENLRKKLKAIICIVFVNDELFDLFSSNTPQNTRIFENKLYFEILNEKNNRIEPVICDILEKKEIKNENEKYCLKFFCSIIL